MARPDDGAADRHVDCVHPIRHVFPCPARLDRAIATLVEPAGYFDKCILVKIAGRMLWDSAMSTVRDRSEEHTSELQSLMRISYAVFCLKKKKTKTNKPQ